MPKWTEEQLKAINETGTNIIVSAGAGSGKTAVLTERVINNLLKGIKIDELIVLTFTNAAALEMKERIRKKIMDYPELKDNLLLLDAASITTFDSWTLSLVKQYNYLLNISPNLSIADNSFMDMKKEEILDSVFDELYEEDNEKFIKLINDFVIKDDALLKKQFLKIIKKIELLSNRDEYLDSYLEKNFNESVINGYIDEYVNLIIKEIDDIETNLYYLSESNYSDYYDSMSKALDKLIKSKTYEDILINSQVKLPRRPSSSEDIKIYKDNIDSALKRIISFVRYKDTEEIHNTFNITADYVEVLITIIKRYFKKIDEYKFENDLYEFTDIELLAIRLLKEQDSIREEIRNKTKEICVDEYQDTNDLQEEVINLIANNNVYMVGDIKQSIYGFRNANPSLFKSKYDNYSNNWGGIKIDLLNNFRSRKEVIEGINTIFSLIMDDLIGGADYASSHQMKEANKSYEDNLANNQNYNLEIYNYSKENNGYSKEEIECFIIGRDIINKINNNYLVWDKDNNTLRKARYEDFAIIMDRGASFSLMTKVFNYLNIPITVYEDKKLTNEIDIIMINNIIQLLFKIKDNILDNKFKYYFMSVARSYLFEYEDKVIFNIIKNNSYKETDIYNKCLDIISNIDNIDSYELINIILDRFNYYENLIKIGSIEDAIIRIDNLCDMASYLTELGWTIRDFSEYLIKIIDSSKEITYKNTINDSSSVKLMNIHKSKGLEFPVCYFCGLHKEFNTMDIKERWIFDNKYGLITPIFNDGVSSSILKDLLKEKYLIDNVSEEIRLFYVALTRAKEKIIIVTSLDEERLSLNKLVDISIKRKYNSFLSFLNSINIDKYITDIKIDNYNLTKDYLYRKNNLLELKNKEEKITFKNISIEKYNKVNKNASKKIIDRISLHDDELLTKGTNIHKIFEETDFLNIEDDNPYKKEISSLVKLLNITKETKIIKEHEFMFAKDNNNYYGIIDLLLIESNMIKIVDYKLKNIDDLEYEKQLKIYYDYIQMVLKKDAKVYLYSIMDDKIKEIKI